MPPAAPQTADVTVIGGGLAGTAAALHLAKVGLRVVCIEPETDVRQPVGESLDWSSPDLLAGVDLPMMDLIQSGIATYKRGVTLKLRDGPSKEYSPAPWLGLAPFNIELRTTHEGTTIYVEVQPGSYLEWIWEIPIRQDTLSVGYVTTGDVIRAERQRGLSIENLLTSHLRRFPRLASLLQTGSDGIPCVTVFKCRTYKGVSGPNWMIVGEAASMVAPITSNGVTAALRHAAEASGLIVEFRGRSELPSAGRKLHSRRVLQMSRFFNSGIEQLVYDWPVRDRIRIERAATCYTSAAWIMNAVYARLRPGGWLSTLTLGAVLGLLRAGARITYRWCKRSRHGDTCKRNV